MCEQVCNGQGDRITNLRAAEKELRDELRAMAHFNGLTPAEAERLALLMEEMGEAQQIIGKILRHGYESYHPEDQEKTSNRTLLAREMGHVYAAMQLLIIPQDISGLIIEVSRSEKRKLVKRWMHHQPVTEPV